MKTIFQSIFAKKPTQQELIAQIHNEFDTAEDRLLQQANDILKSLELKDTNGLADKAMRLKNIGFVNVPVVKELAVITEINKKIEIKQVSTKEQTELIQHYKFTYPFQKFLTIDELDRICNKYGLIYAPIANFNQDVPEKNLAEIENAKWLDKQDFTTEEIEFKIIKWENGVSRRIKRLLSSSPIIVKEKYIYSHQEDSLLKNTLKSRGYTKKIPNRWDIYTKAETKIIDKSGLFICAPLNNFNLKGLSKEGRLGYFNVTKTIIEKDPIVFRYCKGGVQIITKWGLEASDPALLNEINN